MTDTVSISKHLLVELAPYEPMNQDEQGGCVWCNIKPEDYGYAERKASHHERDCPWIRARHLLGDIIT